ncbi:MAG: helix-hairpin-helix domain-containing protein [Herbinix sp.]|nr:helix-hairpin-helix domain-containing protein [Herbinix sp.]
MNKKYIITGITCSLLLISGVLYTCAFREESSSAVLLASLSKEENTEKQNGDNQNAIELNSEGSNSEETNTKEQNSTGNQTEEVVVTQKTMSQAQVSEETLIYVHICGAVTNPGVYQVNTGARICDLIELSGGLSKDAAGDYVNQAKQVTDGERIYIPMMEEAENLSIGIDTEGNPSALGESSNDSELININSASAVELMNLPGIGQAKADSIIEYRTTNGNFKTIEDLMNISGIKEGLFSKISSYITVK